MGYIYLLAAIVTEVFGSSMLKWSTVEGSSKLWGTIGVISGFMMALFFLQLTLQYLPLNTAYAVWAGGGTALTVAIGALLFKEQVNGMMIAGILLIIGGVFILNMAKATH
ncbi:DMT family transporter [Pontibacillus salipaludis]|uniref:Quaternary ammonium compound efflux SMR transporter QacH n=1 Tax=Pontibacillus salipaludis TaxID=1697394 RepID=A0ABQ1Q6W7_9BACI|nr:multidrug efflux SMR transporter [Pontibacillus salipaludis]GGD16403.1 quaternary ammonium compound efflux SMR transporter QacH [Pontibacillus salipaludis]